ncbi:hypothetical protein C8F01DRAFT_1264416 [Mycena amicta]|nr:hypothetical protein C8F01DRAFT_1264416 [Mycena amicta]
MVLGVNARKWMTEELARRAISKNITSPIDIVDRRVSRLRRFTLLRRTCSDDEDERPKAKQNKKVDASGLAGKRDGARPMGNSKKKKNKAKKDTPALGDFDVNAVDELYSHKIKETSARRDKKMAIELKKLELQILQQKSKDKQREREQAQQASMQSQQMMGLMATFMQNFGSGQPAHTATGSVFGSASVGGSSQLSQAPATPLGGGLREWLAMSGSPDWYHDYGEDVNLNLGAFGDHGQATSTDTYEQPAR